MASSEEEDGQVNHLPGFGHNDRFATEALEPVTLPAVILFNPDSQCFAHHQLFLRQYLSIGLPLIGAVILDIPVPDASIQFLQRSRASIATFPFQQLSRNTIQHFPDPEFLCFFPR